jgi:hypothetical protein
MTTLIGLILGLVVGGLVYLAEQTTPEPTWLLILSFPVCFTLGGYLFRVWDIGGYRSEQEKRRRS